MADTTSGARSPVDLRIFLWLGCLVAAWLLLAPTSTADGRSCGTPVFNLTEPELDPSPPPDATCVDRNKVRRDQAIVTIVGTLVVLGSATFRRFWAEAAQTSPKARALVDTGPDQTTPTDHARGSARRRDREPQ